MSRKTKAAISAVLYILMFVVLPNIALERAPAELLRDASMMLGVDLRNFVITFSILGIVLAGLNIVSGIVKENSYIYLISGIITPLVWYYLSIYGLSFGKPGNFGSTLLSMTSKEGTMSALIEIRIILVILGFAVALEIISSLIEFIAAREEYEESALKQDLG